jgi:uncharacterized membrane protein YbhN (UPF0104 family)
MTAGLDLSLTRRVLGVAALALAAVLAVVALPGLADVRERFAGADAGWLAFALVLEVCSVTAFVVAFRGVFSRVLSWRFSFEVGLSQQAVNVLVPAGGAGGLALGAWALRRHGLPGEQIARRSVAFWLVTSSANFVAVIVVGALVLTGVLGSSASRWYAVVPAALAVVVIAVVLALPRLLPRAGEGRIASAAAAVSGGVQDARRLVPGGGLAVAGGAIGYMAFDIATLAAAFAAFGTTPAAGDLVLAYLLGQLGGLVPLPGGIGGTDGGLVAALVLFGTPLTAALTAVLAYRVFQLGVPVVAGAPAFVVLRRALRRDAPAAEPVRVPVRATLGAC